MQSSKNKKKIKNIQENERRRMNLGIVSVLIKEKVFTA